MENTDLLMQLFQYVMGIIPGDITGNIVSAVTVIVTVCTLIMRFWKEPAQDRKSHKLWQFLHVLASFKKPDEVKEKGSGGKSS
ncbi:hypothetical protein [Commensalibacter papalotli (ex Botero et al. 2024)]|uniref:Holin n=1 Tax=Commensalibacter papalotli (ex Botero et al. 2024) TaxID=2972766 RepID=A0ABM9HKQ1_9PROT|nr:hypothetical protein [Commensalibacter papalotli (ex Botero et al. 2024)]CAI3931729.1 unnamed protein product [Commensalibacter papalotli (ex Botero et al. 2024)]CAI3946974.1 unnamed protein product [Commensalibacter papalotli (ex Botero et al. 2024)]